ncbi:MAG: TIGR03087 family PEP-CTERM/XrtA system glycosyltransferase [Burkholderiaceae bacterium]|nr:TIGR03087 family PEP-CTERM/XrtA system glycosyltransferase [Burkholderiaceae bacterium]
MRILFLCHRFPYPADGGGKIRALEMIRALGRSHEVDVVSMLRDDDEASKAPGLAQFCAGYDAPRVGGAGQWLRVGLGVLGARSLSEGYFGSPAVAAAVSRRLAGTRYDRIVVHCSSMAPYVAGVRDIPKLLDLCDVDSEKWRMYADATPGPRGLVYRYEQHAVARLERRMVAAYDLSTVATPNELESLRGIDPDARTDWFPNGVDVVRFAPLEQAPDPDRLCFVGRMDYLPNEQTVVDFCEHTLPLIRKSRPGTRFVIIGANPSERVRQLASLEGVEVTGTVDDVRPELGRSVAMVAPLTIARGVQNKILESMAMGVPVVTSRLAARGVDAQPHRDLLCADTPAEVAEAALGLLGDPARRRAFSDAGLALVRDRYTWANSLARFERMVAGLDGEGASC